MNPALLDSLLGSGSVTRFHATPGLRAQTIAHHSWRVAMIARELWGEPTAREWLLYLTHDCGEVYTGDLPAPFKWENDALASMLNKAEAEARSAMGVELEGLNFEERRRLKIADGFELMITALELRKEGNQNADVVFLRIGERVLHRMRAAEFNGTGAAELELFRVLVMRYQAVGYPQGTEMLEGLAQELEEMK